ncbi:60S acidic ribosomal protein P1-alpha 3 [Termitomyces sp. J132]|nr:60S acidic ribosomal protein P1-alpha 3 [Termitomyces sp. J132]
MPHSATGVSPFYANKGYNPQPMLSLKDILSHVAHKVAEDLCSLHASAELASTYAALILADEGIEITSDKILKLTNEAGIELEPIWASLLAKALEGKNVKDLLSNVGSGGGAPAASAAPAAVGGAAPAAEAPKEEAKPEKEEESDDDMGFGLFD